MGGLRGLVAIILSVGFHAAILCFMDFGIESAPARPVPSGPISVRMDFGPVHGIDAGKPFLDGQKISPSKTKTAEPSELAAADNSLESAVLAKEAASPVAVQGGTLASVDASGQSSIIEPAPIKAVAPDYPILARRMGLEGTVILNVHVDSFGRPFKVQVLAPRTHPLLEKAAEKAFMAALYTPGSQDKIPVPGIFRTKIKFQLVS